MNQFFMSGLTISEFLGEVREVIRQELTASNSNKIDNDPSTGKHYLNAAEAAGFMGIKLQTLYQNIDKVPHVKKFGKLAFVESDLVAHMETGRSATKRASENIGAKKSRKGAGNA